ncbi:MAG TPA: hypothetical protein DEB06_08195 [Phycisphaerales bacterium]|nr:hypothetical protein [Phycisphaerales bacterium]
MSPIIRRLGSALALFGVEPRRTWRALRGLRPFLGNRAVLRSQFEASAAKEFPFGKLYPCLTDRFESSGVASGHYFHQDLLVAQWIFENNPKRHCDVGSRVDGFVAHVATFREVEVFDIRALRTSSRNIRFRRCDLMDGRTVADVRTDSLSCLHTLEHLGLGRYGDPVDYDGWRKGWDTLHAMLEPGGRLYFSVPMGKQRIEFDAHRVFGVGFMTERMFAGRYEVERFAYVDDSGELHTGQDPRGEGAGRDFGCVWGCAIFQLRKIA